MKAIRPATMLALAALVAAPLAGMARTKLVTLPDRAGLLVNLERTGYSLMTEEREVPLQKGTNHVDFSWQGVSIDNSSITLELLSNPGDGADATKIINVAFPPNEAALTWQLYSPEARTERIRVSYLLYGITRESSYEMTADADEKSAIFRQYFRMGNQSGEDLDDAGIRIAHAEDWTRSVRSGEVRRFLSYEKRDLPIRKLFICSPAPAAQNVDGEQIDLVYEIANKPDSGLGEFLLEPGKARLFSVDPDGTTIFTGEDYLAEAAVGEESRMTLGTVRDVVLKRHIMADRREEERTNHNDQVVLYDRVVHLRYEVENFKDKPATVRVVERLPQDAVLVESDTDGVRATRKDGGTLEVEIDLEPRPEDAKDAVPVREVNLIYRVKDVVAQDRQKRSRR